MQTLAELRARPHDRDAWLVHADWLQAQGDPRGELIAVGDVAATTADPAEFERARARARALVEQHPQLLPPLPCDVGAPRRSVWATWERGFVRRLELLIDQPSPGDARREFGPGPSGWAELLATMMEHPSLALLEHLFVRVDMRGEPLDETMIALDVAIRGLTRWRALADPRPPLRLDLWTARLPTHSARERLTGALPELRPYWFSSDITVIPPPRGHAALALERALRGLHAHDDAARFDLLWLDARGQSLARLAARGYSSWALDYQGEWQVHVRRLAELRARELFSADLMPARRVAQLLDGLAARLEPRGDMAPRLAPQLERVELGQALRRLEPLSTAIPSVAAPVLAGVAASHGWYWVVEACEQQRWCGVIGLDQREIVVLAVIG